MKLEAPYHIREHYNGCISIRKSNTLRTKKIINFFIFPVLYFLVFLSLKQKSPHAFGVELSWTYTILLIFFCIVLITQLTFSIRRTIRIISDVKLCKHDILLLKNEPVQKRNHAEKILIRIQDVGAIHGVGGAFTVGLSYGNNFFGLCFELKKSDAKIVAEFIASNLGYEIEYREAVAFPLFRLH